MDWTVVQVTLWQLSRKKSLIAKRSEMKGNSGHTSKADFGSAFVSSNPPTPASQCGLLLFDFRLQWACHPLKRRDGSSNNRAHH